MKDLIAAIMLAAANLQGSQPTADPSSPILAQITSTIDAGEYSVAIGYCSEVPADVKGDILFGEYTTAPAGVNGFVNIGNKWCGLRATGETVPCPPPVAEPCGAFSGDHIHVN